MAGMGPTPKGSDQRRRRNAPLANTTVLPAEGRPGTAPDWPLDGPVPSFWVKLWRRPQAVQWDRLGWVRPVARYARLTELTEVGRPSALVLQEVRQLEDRLGLSPLAMLRFGGRLQSLLTFPKSLRSPRGGSGCVLWPRSSTPAVPPSAAL